jgi:predicted ATPase
VLIEFKVTNFRSIRDEQSLSLVASNYSDELPQNLIETPLPGLAGAKLLKAAAIYGANASGKSNLIEALGFVVRFVRDSATDLKPDAPTGTQHFKLDPACEQLPSKFELHGVIKGMRMLYGLEVTSQRVTCEYLVAYPKGKPQVWFERDWNEDGNHYEWSKSSGNFPHDEALRSKARENASFVSMSAQFGQNQAVDVWDWFDYAFRFDDPEDSGGDPIATWIADKEFKTSLLRALTQADLGVVDVKPPPPEEDRGRVPRHLLDLLDAFSLKPKSKLVHRGRGNTMVPLDFEREESRGTRRFLALLSECFRDAKRGRLVVVDELESSLHPLLVREIIILFSTFPATWDGCCSQLIFTTHNPLLLDQSLLRRDQIWFTEKDQEGATRLYPLTDFKPRKEEALVKGYLSGRYGGIPFIPDGLMAEK